MANRRCPRCKRIAGGGGLAPPFETMFSSSFSFFLFFSFSFFLFPFSSSSFTRIVNAQRGRPCSFPSGVRDRQERAEGTGERMMCFKRDPASRRPTCAKVFSTNRPLSNPTDPYLQRVCLPAQTIVMGGHHASSFPPSLLQASAHSASALALCSSLPQTCSQQCQPKLKYLFRHISFSVQSFGLEDSRTLWQYPRMVVTQLRGNESSGCADPSSSSTGIVARSTPFLLAALETAHANVTRCWL